MSIPELGSWPERESSPFALDQIIALRRSDLFERVLIGRLTSFLERTHDRSKGHWQASEFGQPYDPKTAKALTLASAVMFGALLDKRVWAEFHRVCCTPVSDFRSTLPEWIVPDRPVRSADRVWINLLLGQHGGKSSHRRWIADPLTHLMLLRFQSTGRQTAIAPSVVEQKITAQLEPQSKLPTNGLTTSSYQTFDHVAELAHAFGASGWDYAFQKDLADGFFAAAVIKWRTRMPGFLVESLLEERQSTTLPEDHWERLLGRKARKIIMQKKEIKPRRPWQPKDPVTSLIADNLPDSRASRPQEFRSAALALFEASRRNEISPVERYILSWAAARLDPSVDPRQRRKRLAPSTIKTRASALIGILRDAFGEHDPWMLSPTQLADVLNDVVAARGVRTTDIDHLSCFLDWQNRSVESEALEISERPLRIATSPKAGVITPAEYAQLLERFDGTASEGAISRILLMLGFRAGLRLQEAIHLNLEDVTVGQSCVELQVRDNKERRTKTLAGRRVLPLHCLFEPVELGEFKAWWLNRKAEVTVDQACHELDGNQRLFPKTDDMFDARLRRDLEHEIRLITGDPSAVFHVLRHSFASYLIATLTLPFDVPDDELALPIDKSVVSHERRKRIAPLLLGDGKLGQNAVQAAGALLGHSGERSTLLSYFHLHDWLAANYVARPANSRAVGNKLAAHLLDMTEEAVGRSARRKQTKGDIGPSIRRKRGRPARRDHAFGAIQLRDFITAPKAEVDRCPALSPARSHLHGNGEPSWQVLAGFIQASTPEERELVRHHAALSTPYGKLLLENLENVLLITTKGSKGTSTRRFEAIEAQKRQRSTRRLGKNEQAVLAMLHQGFRRVPPEAMQVVNESFRTGYDRARGQISVDNAVCDVFIDALLTAGLSRPEIRIERRARTVLVRLGEVQMHRGYVWGILFACAAHAAVASLSQQSTK